VHISTISVNISLLLFAIVVQCSTFLIKPEYYSLSNHLKSLPNKQKIVKKLVVIFIVGLAPIMLGLDDVLRYEYYLGYDPYRNEPLISSIIQNQLNPSEFLSSHGIVFSGFYYFGAVLNVSTGVSTHCFTRFGGLAILFLLSSILFLVVHRLFHENWAILVPIFFALNPFVIDRFVMTIRENLAFLFLLLLIFFLLKLETKYQKYNIFISALIFGALLSTNPLTLAFASVIVLFFIITRKNLKAYPLVIVCGCLLAFPILGIFFSWLGWVIIAEIQITLGQSEILTPPWLSTQQILSGWGRGILLEDFSILEIFLLPLGILYALRRKNKKMLFLIPLCFMSITLFILGNIGFHFTLVRLVIYIALPLAVLSALGLKEIVTMGSEYLQSLIAESERIPPSKKKIETILIVLIFVPLIFFSSITVVSSNKWSPYVSGQVTAANSLKDHLGETDAIVIPSINDIGLLDYVGIESASHWKNLTVVDHVLRATTFEELRGLIENVYPNKTKAYLFFSKRWISSYEKEYNFTLLKTLDEITTEGGVVEELPTTQDAFIFKINLDLVENIVKDDDGEIDEWVGIAFDHRKTMKKLFWEKNGNISSTSLSLYLKKRDYDESGTYEGNWGLSINGHNYTFSWDGISEEGAWIKIEISFSELELENEIILFKESPDHILVGLDVDNDFNRSAFYYLEEWNYQELGKWYGTFNGEFMIRLLIATET